MCYFVTEIIYFCMQQLHAFGSHYHDRYISSMMLEVVINSVEAFHVLPTSKHNRITLYLEYLLLSLLLIITIVTA